MSEKKRARKGIESIERQIELHRDKLMRAEEDGNVGLINYYEKEIQNFEHVKEKLKQRVGTKSKRKKQK
jgi:hypothetical protein